MRKQRVSYKTFVKRQYSLPDSLLEMSRQSLQLQLDGGEETDGEPTIVFADDVPSDAFALATRVVYEEFESRGILERIPYSGVGCLLGGKDVKEWRVKVSKRSETHEQLGYDS
jgi:hypothetical protein